MLIILNQKGKYSGIHYPVDKEEIRKHHESQGEISLWDTEYPYPEIPSVDDFITSFPSHPLWGTPDWDMFLKNDKILRLWKAAHAYQESRIDANGIAAMIHKVGQEGSHVKATSNIEWWQGLWSDYEVRRQKILDGVEYSLDFSNNGDIPFRVHEAMSE